MTAAKPQACKGETCT